MASSQHGRVVQFSTLTVPTTTYSFTYTTASGTTSAPLFATPLSTPTFTPFIARHECCNRSALIPPNPNSQNASCAISNADCVNPHSFWDLSACCNGAEVKEAGLSGSGEFDGCEATCDAVGQTWQELMGCLQKRTQAVVCKPDDSEILGGKYTVVESVYATTTTSSSTTSSPTFTNRIGVDEKARPLNGAAGGIDLRLIKKSRTDIAILTIVMYSVLIDLML